MKKKLQSEGKVRLGIVGCGYWGPNLIRNFIQVPGSRVVVACDIDGERLARMETLYPFLETTTDFAEFLTQDIDAIVIATPLSTHFSIAKKALEMGKHVLVEKPFVGSSKEARELVRLAKRRGLVLMVDNTFEYTAAVNKIKQLVDSGQLGKIYTVDMIRVNLGLFQKDHNVIWDLAYHDLSILLYIFSKMPESVMAIGEDFIQDGIEDSAYVILKFPGKMLAVIHLSWLAPQKVRQATFVGSKKMLVFDDIETTEKIKIYEKGADLNTKILPQMKYYESFAEFTFLYRSGNIFIPRLDQTEPLKAMAEHFIGVIKSKKEPKSSGKKAMRIIQILEAANKSLKTGGAEVKIND